MTDKKITARARVTLTIEISVDDVWGDDCPMSQIHCQARESALNALRDGVSIDGLKRYGKEKPKEVRLVDQPKVVAILCERLP